MIASTKINISAFFEEATKKHFISNERRVLLFEIAHKIINEYLKNKIVNINFICTHNSRRSQMGQVWTFFAIEYFKLKNMFAYSGGTKVTSFHRNSVRCLQKTGFEFSVIDFSHQNPKYLITFKDTNKSILGFSKLYNDNENNYPHIVIITCNSAREDCPIITDEAHRFYLPFTDPKIYDKADFIEDKYLKISQQIAGEIHIIFNEVKTVLDKIKNT